MTCPSVAIIGGGLAGQAAAVAACAVGLQVELFEARRQLGGRVSSFRDPCTGQWVDFCQHVALGCCTNLADFCRRTGVAGCFHRYRHLHFIGPDAAVYPFASSGWLPAPLHLLPGLMRLGYLTRRERWAIARGLLRLARQRIAQAQQAETIGVWLRRQGQSEQAIERFWSVVLLSALGETVDRASLAAAQKVFVEGFLGSRRAYELVVPGLPLGEIFDRRVSQWLSEQGCVVHRGTRIRQICGDARRASGVVLPDGSRRQFDFLIAAVPWRQVRRLFADELFAAMPALSNVERIAPAPITAVHLWFDRPITALPHAVLVGRTSQWVFSPFAAGTADATSRLAAAGTAASAGAEPTCRRPLNAGGGPSHYCQVVISASRPLVGRKREHILAEVRRELEAVWPVAREAQLLHSRVVTHAAAVFSVAPGTDRLRPGQQTPVENLLLAGDWTATGWPATMEGAVRSGYLAVEAILKTLGRREQLLAPDLPRGVLTRVLWR